MIGGMTSTAASTGPADDRPRLGELLVAMGALTEDQLREVLARQRETNEPLGRLLVESGHVLPSTVAMALADQVGGLIQTEYGFATGHGASPAVERIDVEAAPPAPEPELAAPIRLAEPAPEAEPLQPSPEPLKLAPLPEPVGPSQAELDAERDARETAELAAAGLSEQIGRLASQVAALQAELAGERDARMIERRELDQLRAEAQAAAEAVPAPRFDYGSHLLFVREVERYRLHDRPGPVPVEGSVVVVDGAEFEVLHVG